MLISTISNGKADSQGPQEHQVKFLKDWNSFYEHQLCKKYSMRSCSVIPFSEQEHFFAVFLLQISTDNLAIVYVENSLILSHSVKIKEKK